VAQAVQFAILGLGAGAAYTLLAQGIVLIYRGSGIVNFAHGAIAMFAAFFCFLTLVEKHGWPVEGAIPVAVLLAAALGVAIQNGILRFMRATAPIVRLVATLGVLIVLQGIAGQKLWDTDFHQVDQFLPTKNYTLHDWFGFDGELGRVVVQQDRLILVGIAIVLTIGLWAFTRFTKIGLAITASAENERAVSALGWSPNLLATVTWAIGGALAGFAGILLAPNAGLSLTVFTIVVTVSALAVALIGGFRSFPLTLAGGLALGIAESEVLTYSTNISNFLRDTLGIDNGATGLQRALPFFVIVVVLVVRGKGLPLRSHVNERLPDLGTGVVTRWFLVTVVAVVLLLNGVAFDVTWSTAVYTSLIAGVLILSIVVLTGYAGQLSLAQYAIGGLGALVASRLVADAHWPAELAFVAGVLFAIVVGAVFAVPALRTRGVNLAVVTLGLGFAIEQVVFNNQYFTGDFGSVTTIGRIEVLGWDVSTAEHPDRFLVVCLVVFVLSALMVANLRRSGTGRRLIAVRNNERAAASLGISVFGTKLYAFAVAAAIASFGGILLAYKDTTVVYTRFASFESINAVGNAVAGGVGWVLGAVFGGNLAPGGVGSIPLDWFDLGSWLITIGGITLIAIVILNPNGIASVMLNDVRGIGRLRMRLRRPPRREELRDEAPAPVAPATLEVEDLTVRYGAVLAVDGVSFRVEPGEVVGLIGPNGAGKTTIVDALTGFTRPSDGRVVLNGTPLVGSSWGPARRARVGIRRSFQSLELFEDISVAENLHVGAAKDARGSSLRDLFWPARPLLPPAAVSSIREFRLEDDLDRLPGELSYGRRRLVGIARAIASAPSVLLLDEPAAGLDDNETEELGDLVRRFAEERGMAVLLIEHDVELVLRVCDRIVVVDFGRKIAEGTPAEVRNDPAVIAAYLGQDAAAAPAPRRSAAAASSIAAPVPSPAPAPLLECRELACGYGSMAVVRDLDLVVDSGEVVALIGPNGAGKTTTLLTLAGELPALSGAVAFGGDPSAGSLARRARRGLGFVTEERSVFMALTTEENLRIAGVEPSRAAAIFPELEPLMSRTAGLLSGGEQQMLTLARALAREPRLLLADELSLGLAPLVVKRLLETVRRAATDQSTGVLLVEQHVRQALHIADRVYVMQRGRIVMSGTAEEVHGRIDEIEATYLSSTDEPSTAT